MHLIEVKAASSLICFKSHYKKSKMWELKKNVRNENMILANYQRVYEEMQIHPDILFEQKMAMFFFVCLI